MLRCRINISLPDDVAKQSIESIKRYFSENLDQEVGDLKASLLLDFILKEIAPSVYNSAIADAQTYLRDRVADLEGACSAPEFAFWDLPAVKRKRN